jgi:drug/metabolite transporter (DMT)-like permease
MDMSSLLPVLLFCLSSSSLLVLNKFCLESFRHPSLLASMQYCTSAGFCILLHATGTVQLDAFSVGRAKASFAYVLCFATAMYTNMRSLQLASVESMIIVRSCCPLLVSVLEALLLGRELPTRRTLLIMVALSISAAGYAAVESKSTFSTDDDSFTSAATWIGAYYIAICMTDTIGKSVLNRLDWKSMWGPVLYTNGMSLPPMMVTAALTGELTRVRGEGAFDGWAFWGRVLPPLCLSCAAAVSISYYGWRCRALCSATGYTVLGVANKLVSVLLSALLFGRPLCLQGAACLLCCLLLASMYRSAPPRSVAGAGEVRKKSQ